MLGGRQGSAEGPTGLEGGYDHQATPVRQAPSARSTSPNRGQVPTTLAPDDDDIPF